MSGAGWRGVWGCGEGILGHGADDVTFADWACTAASRQPRSSERGGQYIAVDDSVGRLDLHALGVEFVAARKAHDSALAIYVFF